MVQLIHWGNRIIDYCWSDKLGYESEVQDELFVCACVGGWAGLGFSLVYNNTRECFWDVTLG